MQISIELKGIGKKYVNDWIIKDLSLIIDPSDKLVILGGNGSGKSTLLQTIASYLIPTSGTVRWRNEENVLADDHIYRYLSMASPYMELVEDFTLHEIIQHQAQFKSFLPSFSGQEIMQVMQLEQAACKLIRNFSSGMKQRLKLGLAILADCPVLLLDEPCTNLDAPSVQWYQDMILKYAAEKTIIVCSNELAAEYNFCKKSLRLTDYKSLPQA